MTSRAARSRGMPRRSQPSTTARRTPTLFVVGAIVAVVILAAAVALLVSAASSGLAEPASRELVVSGTSLPAMPQTGADPAAGQPLPSISGTGLDGEPLRIGPDAGAQAIVVLAHWCPHCQAEVPVLTDWLASNQVPTGVRVVALSTAIDAARPNYPPSAWLEREGWPQPTLVDDGNSSALEALGVTTFPAFVLVNPDGTVEMRMTGEIGTDAFAAALEAIAP
ncbi:MAG: TlpA family protein disulfide reductase [Candidatus Limnocylindria bacterium]